MSSFAPFKHKVFTSLWIAAVVSNIGTWMHEVGAAWLMTELSGDPLMISLVAASTSLPVFLFVLIAGALADIMDRRKYLLFAQGFMLIVAAALTFCTWGGIMSPWLLLFFTFAIGTGTAFMMPAWDAIIPELVPKKDLQQAVALGSIGVNTARAVGPALAGLIIAQIGIYAVFALNTLSFFGVILALFIWKRSVPVRGMAPERFVGALKSGIRFFRHSKPLQAVLVRSVAFFIPAIALLSLLPIYVREVLQADAQVLGYLQGSMGIGAILTAFFLPTFKKLFSIDVLIVLAAFVLSAAYGLMSMAPSVLAGCVALFLAGTAWVTAFSLLRVAAQQTVPDWVRARAMAIMMMVSFGAMTLGSTIWGQTASVIGLLPTYYITSATTFILALISLPFVLKNIGKSDHSPADDFSYHDDIETVPAHDEGPVLITIRYTVAKGHLNKFMEQIEKLKDIRQRNGGYRWALFKDLEQPEVYIEHFLVETWQEHERQHARTSQSDKETHDAVFVCLENDQKPHISHMLYTDLKPEKSFIR